MSTSENYALQSGIMGTEITSVTATSSSFQSTYTPGLEYAYDPTASEESGGGSGGGGGGTRTLTSNALLGHVFAFDEPLSLLAGLQSGTLERNLFGGLNILLVVPTEALDTSTLKEMKNIHFFIEEVELTDTQLANSPSTRNPLNARGFFLNVYNDDNITVTDLPSPVSLVFETGNDQQGVVYEWNPNTSTWRPVLSSLLFFTTRPGLYALFMDDPQQDAEGENVFDVSGDSLDNDGVSTSSSTDTRTDTPTESTEEYIPTDTDDITPEPPLITLEGTTTPDEQAPSRIPSKYLIYILLFIVVLYPLHKLLRKISSL